MIGPFREPQRHQLSVGKQGDSGGIVCEKINECAISWLFARSLKCLNIFLVKRLSITDAFSALRQEFNVIIESEVAVLGFLMEPLEEHSESAFVAEDSTSIDSETVLILALRSSENAEKGTDVSHFHVDECCSIHSEARRSTPRSAVGSTGVLSD